MIYEKIYELYRVKYGYFDILHAYAIALHDFVVDPLTPEEARDIFTGFDFVPLVETMKQNFYSKKIIQMDKILTEKYTRNIDSERFLRLAQFLSLIFGGDGDSYQGGIWKFLIYSNWGRETFFKKLFTEDMLWHLQSVVNKISEFLAFWELLPLKVIKIIMNRVRKHIYEKPIYNTPLLSEPVIFTERVKKILISILDVFGNLYNSVPNTIDPKNITYPEYIKLVNDRREIEFRGLLINSVVSLYFVKEIEYWLFALKEYCKDLLRIDEKTSKMFVKSPRENTNYVFTIFGGSTKEQFDSLWIRINANFRTYYFEDMHDLLYRKTFQLGFYPVVWSFLLRILSEGKIKIKESYHYVEPFVETVIDSEFYTYIADYFYKYIHYLLSLPEVSNGIKKLLIQNLIPSFLFDDWERTLRYLSLNFLDHFAYVPLYFEGLRPKDYVIKSLKKLNFKVKDYALKRIFRYSRKILRKYEKYTRSFQSII